MTELNAIADDIDFDRTTAMRANQERPGEFAVDLDGAWSSLVGMHGGDMRALAVRGAEALAPGWSVRTVSTGFLRAGTERPTRGTSIGLTVHIHRSGFALHPGDWLADAFDIDDSTAGLAVEHGRLPQMAGTDVAESCQTRLTARD